MLGLAGHFAAGHHERAGRVVIDGVGVDGLDQRDVVDDLGRVRQQLADPLAALAVLLELELRRRDREPRLAAGHRGDALALADAVGQVLVEIFGQLRLVIPQVDLRRAAVHVQIDDRLGLRRESAASPAAADGRASAARSARAERLGRRAEQRRPSRHATAEAQPGWPKNCRRVCSSCVAKKWIHRGI